jgi:hypothetical protein
LRGQALVQRGRGFVGQHLAVVDDDQMVGQPFHFLHVVAGVDQRAALRLQGFQRVEDGIAALRIDAHGGFVEDQQLRLMQQSGRNIQARFMPPEKVEGLSPARSLRLTSASTCSQRCLSCAP